MSYTAPQYVDTKEQAILALASTIADEDKTALGNGSVNKALDVLADVLAQQDVQVPQTNAGAILALAQYVTGGGGGAQTTDVYLWNNNEEDYTDKIPSRVAYVSGYEGSTPTFTELQFEPVTTESLGFTIYGIKVKDCPVGALFNKTSLVIAGNMVDSIAFGYSTDIFAPILSSEFSSSAACPMPINGLVTAGYYLVSGNN